MSRGDQVTVRIPVDEGLAEVVDLYTVEDLEELAERAAVVAVEAADSCDGPSRWSVLSQLLDMDGVTDLAAYRMLSDRGADLSDVPAPPRRPPAAERAPVQLSLFFPITAGGDE